MNLACTMLSCARTLHPVNKKYYFAKLMQNNGDFEDRFVVSQISDTCSCNCYILLYIRLQAFACSDV